MLPRFLGVHDVEISGRTSRLPLVPEVSCQNLVISHPSVGRLACEVGQGTKSPWGSHLRLP